MTERFYRLASKLVRCEAMCSGTPYPIVFQDGFDPPTLQGTAHHYETKGGRMIRHPSAYAKRGRSNMVYIHSTRDIVVGKGWVLQAMLAYEEILYQRRADSKALTRKYRENWESLLREAGDGAAHARARFTAEGGIAGLPDN